MDENISPGIQFKPLEWDSLFFSKKVAKIAVTFGSDTDSLDTCIQDACADVLYIFTDPEDAKCEKIISKHGGICYDHKIILVPLRN